MPNPKILVVDDEGSIRFALRDFLDTGGYDVVEAESLAQAEQVFRESRPDVSVLDYGLPDGNALQLLPRLRALDPTAPVIVLTGQGTIDLAVRAIQEGADHFLVKPVELPTLLVILERLIEQQRANRRRLAGEAHPGRTGTVDPFLGSGAAMARLAEHARRVAEADSPVLILGETGAGKGVLARWLHDHGMRSAEAFVDLNCAGLARDLLESELFGHVKGAFTGAVSTKAGMLEVAHRGTVFLDEIGDVDPLVQPKLLKVVEERRFRRVGEVNDRVVDLRLIAATSHDLTGLVNQGKFRSDLYFRISTLPLRVPALRERRDDIPQLAGQMLERLGAERGRELTLTTAAVEQLQNYSWPGNVRELRNVLERAVLLSGKSNLGPADLHFDAVVPTGATPPAAAGESGESLTLAQLERQHIERVLRECDGRVADAAARLDVPRSSLYQKLKALGISTSKS